MNKNLSSNIRVIALDLDQTLLTTDKRISKGNYKWVQRAKDAGIIVMFSTGRGAQTAERFWQELKLELSPMVLVNGAETWRKPGSILHRQFLPREGVRKLVEFAQNNQANFWGYSVESHTLDQAWTDAMFERDWLKFGMRYNDLARMKQLRERIAGWGSFEVTYADPLNMEVSPLGVSKASGLQKVCDHLRITPQAVMAIGDSHNDMEILKLAGLGVAMGNADEQVKSIADDITASNDEDGVALAIRRHIFKK